MNNKKQDKVLLALLLVFVNLSQSSGQANGDVRLVGNGPNSPKLAGVVEVYLNDEWMRLMQSQTASDHSCRVVCWQLGYSDCWDSGAAKTFDFEYSSNISSILYLHCPVFPPHVLHCIHNEAPRSLSPSHDFAVQCSAHRVDAHPYDTQVRLEGGETGFTSSGFVEMYKNNRWGPVCNMNAADADSACRQLGYTNARSFGNSKEVFFFNEDQADNFTCGNSFGNSHPCLKSCMQKLHSNSMCQSHTYVNCTFLEEHSRNGTSYEAVCGVPFPDPFTIVPYPEPYIPPIKPPNNDNTESDGDTAIIIIGSVMGFIFIFICGIFVTICKYAYKKSNGRRQYVTLE